MSNTQRTKRATAILRDMSLVKTALIGDEVRKKMLADMQAELDELYLADGISPAQAPAQQKR